MKKNLILMAAVIVCMSLTSSYALAQKPKAWAKVLELDGKIWINGHRAHRGSTAQTGDEIKTGEDASAVIKLLDGSVLRMRSDSTIVVREQESFGIIDLLKGKVMAVFSPGPHQLDTQTMVAGVRGTGLYIMNEGPDKTYACVCFGTVDFNAVKDPSVKTTLTADHHKAIWVGVENGQPYIKEVPMLDHSDDEVIYLKTLLDKPFKKTGWWK